MIAVGADFTKQQLADTVIPIRPYKGRTFGEATLSYLRWARRNRAFKTRELQSRLKAWLELPEHKPVKKRRGPHWRTTSARLMRCL